MPLRIVFYIAGFSMFLLSSLAAALDNPDAPNLVADFEARERPLVETIKDVAGYREELLAYTGYLEFLDKELNAVYKTVQSRLPQENQQQLKQSQISWLRYRDLEFALIEATWTKDDFGTSSGMTRGQHKAAIVRARVIQLMHYTTSL